MVAVTQTSIDFTLSDPLPAGSNLSAIVYRMGAPSSPVNIATVVPQPALFDQTNYKRATTASEIIIRGSNLATETPNFQVAFTGPHQSVICTIKELNATLIFCSVSGVNSTGPLAAYVIAYGGESNNVSVASIVPAPSISSSTDYIILNGSISVAINGSGFDVEAGSASTLAAVLSYDSTEANSIPCAPKMSHKGR